MALILPPPDVKLFIAVLYVNSYALDPARKLFVEKWGAIDFEGKDHLFDMTDYYDGEMGTPQYRKLMAFENLADPLILASMKTACNGIENNLAVNGKRQVNCDAGYLDHNKIVLASAKEAGQKIYIGGGIYADLAGRYKDGRYRPFEWSFPDFKDGRYDEELLEIRALYLKQMKEKKRKILRIITPKD
jgi:hypothetical protein